MASLIRGSWGGVGCWGRAGSRLEAALFPAGRCLRLQVAEIGSTSSGDKDPGNKREVLRTSVAIVGGGPTGVTLSLLLSSFGIRNVVLERKARVSNHPQAHFINTRTMEIFRQIGRLEERVRAKSPPMSEWRSFRYCEGVLGHTFGKIDHFEEYEGEESRDLSPTVVAHLSQNRLLPLMHEELEKCPSSTFLWGEEFLGLAPARDGVRMTTRSCRGEDRIVEADYLVGADGAHSLVREAVGIQMKGDGHMQSIMNVHFTSRALASSLKSEASEAMLYFVYNPSVVGVIVAHSIETGDFVAQIPFFPPVESVSKYTEEHCSNLLLSAIRRKVDLEIHNIKPWTMSALVADDFRRDRVFLAGDSAHLFPPAGGFGMNTGVQDAHNLAWKIAYVLRGSACPSILHTYSRERRKIAIKNTCLSIANFEETVKVARAFGLDPGLASGVLKVISQATKISPLQQPLERFGESLLTLGKLQTSSLSPLRPFQQMYLQGLLTQERSLRLLYPEEDIGFCYEDPDIEWSGSKFPKWPKARRSNFSPKIRTGCRFPHLELRLHCNAGAATLPQQDGVSIIDLIGEHKGSFLMLVLANSGRGKEFRSAVRDLQEESQFAVTTVFVNSNPGGAMEPGELLVDADLSHLEPQSDVAIVLRPDGHVARIFKLPIDLSSECLQRELLSLGLKPREKEHRNFEL
ncbi:putative polyketide hydroxylase [Chloropicon primus]|uniref:Putative polyketide hydroxylase n=1 Tax=Chloropicon primus TaxID=1764295 RepID=A0A5B8MBY7_9CHLO|nr:putative polyketide hydroxylase [Chloropicon primus]|eukprot:QDZ17809.1 putative polyketide hydroxylase [Chloropicon primus]